MNTPPAKSLVDDVPCELVQLELEDGYLGRGRLFEAAKARRAVIYLHGIQSHGGWFLRSCDFLRKKGITVWAPERRGSGLNQQERGHCKSSQQLLGDINRGVDWLCRRIGASEVDMVAVSWGGKPALVYAARYPDKVRSVLLVAPGVCPRVDISLREKIGVGVQGLIRRRTLHEIPLNDPGLFTQNPEMLKFMENDPLKLTRATAGFFITSSRLDAAVRQSINRLKAPIYLFLAGRDRIIDNQATIKLLHGALQAIKSASEPWQMYPNAHHTLEFEVDPYKYFEDLADGLL